MDECLIPVCFANCLVGREGDSSNHKVDVENGWCQALVCKIIFAVCVRATDVHSFVFVTVGSHAQTCLVALTHLQPVWYLCLSLKANGLFSSISQSELSYLRGAGADSCLWKRSQPVSTRGLRCACACCMLRSSVFWGSSQEDFTSGEYEWRVHWQAPLGVSVSVVLDSLWQMSSLRLPRAVLINIAADKKSLYPVSARRFH